MHVPRGRDEQAQLCVRDWDAKVGESAAEGHNTIVTDGLRCITLTYIKEGVSDRHSCAGDLSTPPHRRTFIKFLSALSSSISIQKNDEAFY